MSRYDSDSFDYNEDEADSGTEQVSNTAGRKMPCTRTKVESLQVHEWLDNKCVWCGMATVTDDTNNKTVD